MVTPTVNLPRPGLLRRLAAILYDLFLLTGIELIAAMWLPLIPESLRSTQPVKTAILAWVILVAFVFFGFCWTHGGQTLGMRAWKLRACRNDGATLTWSDSLKRFVGAVLSWIPAGLGYLWIVFDGDRRAWHDSLSATRLEFDDRYRVRQPDAT